MSGFLVVVESEEQAAQVQGLLGEAYQVAAPGTARLARAAADADVIFLATSPGAEGEALVARLLPVLQAWAGRCGHIFRLRLAGLSLRALQAALRAPVAVGP
jgi:DNA topoisomerase IA